MKTIKAMFVMTVVLALLLAGCASGSTQASTQPQQTIVVGTTNTETGPKMSIGVPHEDLLRPIYEHWVKGEETAAKDLMRTAAYKAVVEELGGDVASSFYYGQIDAEGLRSGVGIAVYGSGYYYLGEWAGGMRNGAGLWILVQPLAEDSPLANHERYRGDETFYNGEWVNDMPQGAGVVYRNSAMPLANSAGYVEGYFMFEETDTGTFVGGYYDGTFTMKRNYNAEPSEYTETYIMGIVQPLHNPPQYHWNDATKQQYATAKSGDDTIYGWANREITVPGLGIGFWG